jgi:hypothetical protein
MTPKQLVAKQGGVLRRLTAEEFDRVVQWQAQTQAPGTSARLASNRHTKVIVYAGKLRMQDLEAEMKRVLTLEDT